MEIIVHQQNHLEQISTEIINTAERKNEFYSDLSKGLDEIIASINKLKDESNESDKN